MKNLLKTIAISASLLLSASALSYEDTGDVKITAVYVNTGGELLFKMDDHSAGAAVGCTKNNWMKVSTSDDWAKTAMHRQLLVAKSTAATVSVRLDGNCSYYPTTSFIYVK